MGHKCHDESCNVGKLGLAIPLASVPFCGTSNIPTITILEEKDWVTRNIHTNQTIVKELASNLATFLYSNAVGEFMTELKAQYKHKESSY